MEGEGEQGEEAHWLGTPGSDVGRGFFLPTDPGWVLGK